MRRILVLTAAFPSHVMPNFGVFVKERMKAVANLPGFDVRVIAPVPYFPPIKRFKTWYNWSRFPRSEVVDGLHVLRPRYLIAPKVGHFFEANLMYGPVLRAAARLQVEWDFDLIDAHWAHPAGVVAARLGARLDKPVVITGRGADLNEHPESPIVGPQIRRALRKASHCIAVSSEIAERMRENGTDPRRISIIPNGVDTAKFHPLPQQETRQWLGLPRAARIILGVGDCYENKGFHLLIDALPQVRRHFSDALVVIVGGTPRFGSDFTPELRRRISVLGLEEHVRLVGARPHEELVSWYNAADVFCLLSAREGSPNVLLEALACGTPAVATRVGGVPDLLGDDRLGVILPHRSKEAAASGVIAALERSWDRQRIRDIMVKHDWSHRADRLAGVFGDILDETGVSNSSARQAHPQ